LFSLDGTCTIYEAHCTVLSRYVHGVTTTQLLLLLELDSKRREEPEILLRMRSLLSG
jgi:hypothetical protein